MPKHHSEAPILKRVMILNKKSELIYYEVYIVKTSHLLYCINKDFQ